MSRRDRENTGFPQDYELPTPKRIGPGLYQYPLETIGVDADAQRHRLALDDAWENNCKLANLYKKKESIFIQQVQEELIEKMLKLPLRFSAPLFVADVIGLLFDFCNTSITKLAGQAYFLAAGQSSLYLSARATIAAAPNTLSSPLVRWSYSNSDATVAKQVLEMPEAACPSRPLEGRWVGALLLPQDPRAVVSNYAINLMQAGDRLSGTWRIDAAQTTFFGEGTLAGSVSNNAVTLVDTGVTASNLVPPQYWCTKTLDYTFSVINGVDTLDGVFSGGDCLPGTTRITRP